MLDRVGDRRGELMVRMWGALNGCAYSKCGEEGEGVAGHDGGGSVGEPEESYGDGYTRDGDSLAQDGMEEQRDPDGGEEFGVGTAFIRGEEHVGIDDVEGGG